MEFNGNNERAVILPIVRGENYEKWGSPGMPDCMRGEEPGTTIWCCPTAENGDEIG